MNTELADPDDLAAIRTALDVDDDGESALGWRQFVLSSRSTA